MGPPGVRSLAAFFGRSRPFSSPSFAKGAVFAPPPDVAVFVFWSEGTAVFGPVGAPSAGGVTAVASLGLFVEPADLSVSLPASLPVVNGGLKFIIAVIGSNIAFIPAAAPISLPPGTNGFCAGDCPVASWPIKRPQASNPSASRDVSAPSPAYKRPMALAASPPLAVAATCARQSSRKRIASSSGSGMIRFSSFSSFALFPVFSCTVLAVVFSGAGALRAALPLFKGVCAAADDGAGLTSSLSLSLPPARLCDRPFASSVPGAWRFPGFDVAAGSVADLHPLAAAPVLTVCFFGAAFLPRRGAVDFFPV
ncbi:hypothetical protein TMES_12080 [Thalassospira mesophila]|uniref:Uncharacterized protein n=1 Tax=Thalassospira mesophila TaxID=1293891 RepID=A0A1Y2L089_9PROT|nr:hypothetical protein TMES_12080 [Thalassospira mesophila]